MKPTPDNFPTASFHECADIIKRIMPVPPFVVQIGAMDGVRFDLLHPHLIEGGWRGVLAEPLPDMFERLRETYAEHPELTLANCAIADYDGTLTLERIKPEIVASGLIREEALGMASAFKDDRFRKEIIASGHYPDAANDYVESVDVACLTLPHFLEQHGITEIHVMMIDTEGADWMIARQLDLDRFRPSLVCLEYHHLSGDDMRDCCAKFLKHGYQFALCQEDNENLLFYLGR